jgi:transcriptional regulator with XRE-family HTH domain
MLHIATIIKPYRWGYGGIAVRDWLFNERKKQNLTQLELADRAGIARAYYAQIELELRTPSTRIAKKIAAALKIDWTRFYDEQDNES